MIDGAEVKPLLDKERHISLILCDYLTKAHNYLRGRTTHGNL